MNDGWCVTTMIISCETIWDIHLNVSKRFIKHEMKLTKFPSWRIEKCQQSLYKYKIQWENGECYTETRIIKCCNT